KYKLNVSATYVPHDKFAKDVVISQDIAPGTEVYAGSKIGLTVSQGKDTEQVTTAPAEDGSKKYGYVNTAETDLNVRKGPSTDSDRIGSLAKGTKMEIVGSEGNWYKIVYENGYGYVSKDYVKLID
ncbi:MAG: SH3 domain-containing protein, partial [Ruminococcus sp.]|nr:SH3 domain-containing protein [Ruminococcus sp.]